MNTITVNEIFTSIDGEVNTWGQGAFTTFIRLAGCNIRCSYCDTKQSLGRDAGLPMAIEQVMRKVEQIGCNKVTITGGEPLYSPMFSALLEELVKARYRVSVETNGTIMPNNYDTNLPHVSWVFDYKLPSSGAAQCRLSDNLFANALPATSWIKMVIADDLDWEEALRFYYYAESCGKFHRTIAFSPCMGDRAEITPAQLIERCISARLFDVVINCQIHKFLGVA